MDEAHKRQLEEATGTLSEGPKKGFYKSRLDWVVATRSKRTSRAPSRV